MKKFLLTVLIIFLFLGCQSDQLVNGEKESILTPFVPSENDKPKVQTSTAEIETNPTVVPTAEPVTHVVVLGETVSSIALQYGVTMDAIRAANPEANPNTLLVGEELVIPLEDNHARTVLDAEVIRSIQFSDANCVPTRDSGLWCAVMAENKGDTALENIVVDFSFFDFDGNVIEVKNTPAVMRFFPAESFLPAVIFLKMESTEFFRVTPSLFSAQVANSTDKAYFPVMVENETQSLKGIQATISGIMRIETDQQMDRVNVSICAVGFDADDTLVGVRRMDYEVASNEAFNFEISVYAAENNIARVELLTEAF